MKREIIYSIFLECSDFCTDNYWKNIFEDLAYGQAPYGTYISKGFFCCNYKNKEFSYKIEKKDARKLFDDICGLCKKIGLLSHDDKIQKKIDFQKKDTTFSLLIEILRTIYITFFQRGLHWATLNLPNCQVRILR